MGKKFKDFQNQVADLIRAEMQTDIEDLTDIRSTTMREYWSRGQSPDDFFQDQVAAIPIKPIDAYTDEEFDPYFEAGVPRRSS